MSTSPDYSPPASADIKARQDELDALRLLIAQRRLYRKAKRSLGLRWLGMVVIGIGAPVISVTWPSLAVVAGAAAGAWIFLARTVLMVVQTRLTDQAAAVQEKFDFYVFDMPDTTRRRSALPSPERISAVAGADDEIQQAAQTEKLIGWYAVNEQDDGATAVAIAQRANAAYSDELLRTTAIAWSIITVVWVLALVVVSLLAGLSLATFLLGVVLPVLPAFLDVVQYVTGVWRSAGDRADLARAIEDKVRAGSSPDPQELLVWQERLFDLRRAAPEVPDLLYKLKRRTNERAMKSAADQLSRRARGDD